MPKLTKHTLAGNAGTIFMLTLFTVVWAVFVPVYIGWNPVTIVCLAVFVVYAIWLYIAATVTIHAVRKLPDSPITEDEKRMGEHIAVVFGIEIILIIAVIVVANIIGKYNYITPAIMFVVGAHCIPLGIFIKKRLHIVIGIIMTAVAVAAIILVAFSQRIHQTIGICALAGALCVAVMATYLLYSVRIELKNSK